MFFPAEGSAEDGSPEDGSDEAVVGRTYVKKKLEHGLNRIWQVKHIDLTLHTRNLCVSAVCLSFYSICLSDQPFCPCLFFF